jgi:hypothetical protein
MLDPYVEGWAREAGMEPGTVSSIFGGNILGGLISLPLDMFLTTFGSKLAEAALGGVGLLLGTYSFKGQGRLQLDTMQVGSRLFSALLDPSPQQIAEIRRNIGDMVDGFVYGRWDKIAYAVFRNPREFTGIASPPSQPSQPPSQARPAAQKTTEPSGIDASGLLGPVSPETTVLPPNIFIRP